MTGQTFAPMNRERWPPTAVSTGATAATAVVLKPGRRTDRLEQRNQWEYSDDKRHYCFGDVEQPFEHVVSFDSIMSG